MSLAVLTIRLLIAASVGGTLNANETAAVPPDFTLLAADGQRYSLREGEPRAVVLVFLSAECPVAKLYAPRLAEMERAYRSRGVRFLGVDSNYQDDEGEVKQAAEVAGLSFPVLLDPDQRVADRFEVKRASEVLVLDANYAVQYRGAVDDQYGVGTSKDAPAANYLRDALEQVLSGEVVKVATSKTAGCLLGRMPDGKRKEGATFHRDVLPILQQNCQVCHRPGEIGPMALIDYQDVAAWAPMIAEVVSQGRMPPWHADARYGTFSNRRLLTDHEKETLLQWAEDGTPEGSVADDPTPVEWPSEEWHIGRPDAVYQIPDPINVPSQGTVPYKYVRVPTNLTEGKWVQAVEVKPGNRAVVHHVLVFIETREEQEKNKGIFLPTDGTDVKGHMGVFVPGQGPMIYPQGMAKLLPAGANLVFQIHYTPNGKPATDQSLVALKFTDEEPSQHVVTTAIVNVGLKIPPNKKGVEFTAERTFDKPISLISYFPHMHVRGQAFKIELEHKSGRRTLLSVPSYDFRWQHVYRLAEPMPIEPGTKLICTAWYDNSTGNPSNPDPGKTVRWGDQTWEEMLVGYIEYVIDD